MKEVLDLEGMHWKGAVKTQCLLAQKFLGCSIYLGLSSAEGVCKFIAAGLRREKRHNCAVRLHRRDHGAHGILMPSLYQNNLPVEDTCRGKQVIQPVLQPLDLAGNFLFFYPEMF